VKGREERKDGGKEGTPFARQEPLKHARSEWEWIQDDKH
jgi:hypothetical protein